MAAPTLDRVLDAVIRIDKDATLQYVSSAGLRWFGAETVRQVAQHFTDLLSPDDAKSLLALMATGDEAFSCDLQVRKRQGTQATGVGGGGGSTGQDNVDVPVHVRGYQLPGAQQFTLCIMDTTRWRSESMSYRHAALHDDLTGLPNRAFLKATVENLLEVKRPFVLALLDLDGFKGVNDSFGHAAGDEVLCEATRRLNKVVGSSGVLARLGGDEFVILLPDLDALAAEQKLGAVLLALARPFEPYNAYVGVSIGIAEHPAHGDTHSLLLKNADTAMYHAKNSGRGRICTFKEAPDTLDFSLRSALHQGIQDGEMFLVYQPQFDTERRLVGVEALMRWTSQAFGRVGPDRFIPVAESAGLMPFLGQWALRYACHQLKEFARHMPAFKMSVNVSPVQLATEGFAKMVLDTIAESGVDPAGLVLEITESTLMTNREIAEIEMQHLRQHGIQFAIDDFGTGYSCLSYLARLPVSSLKIDRSFVSPLDENTAKSAASHKILGAILNLAKSLDLKVVAEGVESEHQFGILKDAGCHFIQGYLLGKPVPAEDVLALLVQPEGALA